MKVAYLDTSALLAIAFNEPGARELNAEVSTFRLLLSSDLLEAEVRSAFVRHQRTDYRTVLDPIEWISPGRRLTDEMDQVLSGGYLRGADLYHVATALLVSADFPDFTFATMDFQQLEVARRVGLKTLSVQRAG